MTAVSTSAVALPEFSRSQWSWHLGALAIVAVLVLALFRFEVSDAVQVWWNYPTYSHCFLILPISAWLVWRIRPQLAQLTPVLAPKALFAVPFILLIWLAGNFGTMNEVRQFAVISLLVIVIFALLGPRIFRAVLFPVLYLFFLVPFGQYLIPPMQQFATAFTDAGLSLLGVPHYTEGTTIELANGRFEIAEACAGLRFLIATVALGVLFAHMTYRRWHKIALFMIACIVVPLIGNGLRCLGIIELAHMTNNQLAVGADHLIYGWIFNTAILLVLMVVGLRFRDEIVEVDPARASPVGAESSRIWIISTAVACVLAVAVGPVFAVWHEVKPIEMNPNIVTGQLGLDGWTDKAPGTWRPIYGADALWITKFNPSSLASGESIDVAVAYYARNRVSRSLVATTNRLWDSGIWRQVDARNLSTHIGRDTVQVKESVITSGPEQRLIWWTYWMDGTFTTSSMTIKLLQLKTVFTGNEAAALIAFSTPIDGAIEDARARLHAGLAGLSGRESRALAVSRSGNSP